MTPRSLMSARLSGARRIGNLEEMSSVPDLVNPDTGGQRPVNFIN
jgi:hypothetical protein